MDLRTKISLPTIFLLVTISFLVHFYWLPIYKEAEINNQHHVESEYIKLLGDAIISDILASDLATLTVTLNKILKERKEWRQILLYKSNGQRIYPLFEETLPDHSSLHIIRNNIKFKDKPIANIIVWTDIETPINNSLKFINYLEVLLIGLLTGVSLLTLLFQDRWIRTPIKKLSFYAHEIATGNYKEEYIYQSQDEIGKLATAFNSMRQQVSSREEELKNYSKTLEKLHNIFADMNLTLEQKLDSLLKLGLKIFDLNLAIISYIVNDVYTVRNIVGPPDSPKPGDQFVLGDTFCDLTIGMDSPVGFHEVGLSEYKDHPCYRNFSLESYIGAPIKMNGVLYGTINFSSSKPRNKPFNKTEYTLIQIFAQWIGTELTRVGFEEELEKLSRTDGLTGVANRRYFDEMLAKELHRAIRNNSPTSLIICDIDHFKNYNDTYGHKEGDECLKKVSAALSSSFSRTGEIVARYGGEEFAIIIPAVEAEDAYKQAEKMHASVNELNIKHVSSKTADHVTISAGLVTIYPDQSTTSADIIEKADLALYQAKNRGRNNIQVFKAKSQ